MKYAVAQVYQDRRESNGKWRVKRYLTRRDYQQGIGPVTKFDSKDSALRFAQNAAREVVVLN